MKRSVNWIDAAVGFLGGFVLLFVIPKMLGHSVFGLPEFLLTIVIMLIALIYSKVKKR